MVKNKISLHREYEINEKGRCVINIEFYDTSLESINSIEKSVEGFINFAENVLKESRAKDIESIRRINAT